MIRSTIATAFTIIVIMVTAGCGEVGPAAGPDARVGIQASDVVGAWKSDSSNFVFDTDQTFVANGIPTGYFTDFPGALPSGYADNNSVVDGSGKWSLAASQYDPTGPQDVVAIVFTSIQGRTTSGPLIDFSVQCFHSDVVLAFEDTNLAKTNLTCSVGNPDPIRR